MTLPDLLAARELVIQGHTSAQSLLEAAQAVSAPHAFVRRFDEPARAAARAADLLVAAQAPLPPLAGLAVSVKDLFDVQGQPTTAGTP